MQGYAGRPLLIRRLCVLRALLQDVADGRKAEILQQTVKTLLGLVEVEVVPEAALYPGVFHSRLPGVEFPGMNVEQKGSLLPRVDLPESGAGERIGVEPEIATACNRSYNFV